MSTPDEKDIYGGNFQKSKRLAISRSGGKCQFCGLRKAEEGHHWAWPDYPSGEEVQGHDLTALCPTCHELAILLRDWVGRKSASFDEISNKINSATSFYQKREAFSAWLFPEAKSAKTKTYQSQIATPTVSIPPRNPRSPSTSSRSSRKGRPVKTFAQERQDRRRAKEFLNSYQFNLDMAKQTRWAIKNQMDRLERGEVVDSYHAQKDIEIITRDTHLPPHASWSELEEEYRSIGREMAININKAKGMKKTTRTMSAEGKMWLIFFWIPIAVFVLFIVVASTAN